MTSVPYALSSTAVGARSKALSLDAGAFARLFRLLGPSLALWRGAEIAALRACTWTHPVLDLGCGDGLVTSLVLGRVEIGVDPWEDAVRAAAARALYGRLLACDIQHTRLPACSVATIVSNSVLEHVVDIGRVLEAVARLLSPHGRLVFTVPSAAFGSWLLLPSARYAAWRNRSYDHRNLWTVREWEQRLNRVGLELEEAQSYLRRPAVMAWDALELAQRVWIGKRRPFGEAWKHLPSRVVEAFARAASHLDLSSPAPGGGQLIVARKKA